MKFTSKPPQALQIEHLHELRRRCDELYDFHEPYMRWCRLLPAFAKLDVDARWEIDRFEYEIRYAAWYEQDFKAKQAASAAKRKATIARKKLELAESGK